MATVAVKKSGRRGQGAPRIRQELVRSGPGEFRRAALQWRENGKLDMSDDELVQVATWIVGQAFGPDAIAIVRQIGMLEPEDHEALVDLLQSHALDGSDGGFPRSIEALRTRWAELTQFEQSDFNLGDDEADRNAASGSE